MKFNNLKEYNNWLSIKGNLNKNINIECDFKEDCENLKSFYKFYYETKKECEKYINKVNKSFICENDNKLVKDAVNELIRMNSDGKFIRAALIKLGYLISNKNDNKYLPLATSYETFQTSILIHDDIIDNATTRRGKKTIPASYGEKFDKYEKRTIKDYNEKRNHISDSLGICIGDLGFFLLSDVILKNYGNNKNIIDLISYYNKIVINTIKGEIIDVILPFNEEFKNNNNSKENDVFEIYKLKTAWYSIIGPFNLGMILGNSSKRHIKEMENTLNSIGLAFQIKDDILGIYGNEAELGKSTSSDISEFKQTILYTYITNKDIDLKNKLLKHYGKDNLSHKDIKTVQEIFTNNGALEYASKKMTKLFNESKYLINNNKFIKKEYKNILNGFITYLELRNK